MCKELSPKELIDSPFSKMYSSHMRFADVVHNTFRKIEHLPTLEHEWIWGEPGTGKTRGVWDKYPDLYVKNLNKWWDGYAD